MSRIFLEGGGDSKEQHARCREGFRKLLEKCGYQGRLPRLVASGSRNTVLGDFKTALDQPLSPGFVGMMLDSEDPVNDINRTWKHLWERDRWPQPPNAQDDQVLFMTTCMETWIVCDRTALSEHYGAELQESALPPLANLEKRAREAIQDSLHHATRNCSNAYLKGNRVFRVLAELDPDVLRRHLPSFARIRRILDSHL